MNPAEPSPTTVETNVEFRKGVETKFDAEER
jgi:hypothetical protein